MAVDCAFCREASWFGKNHMTACPTEQLKVMDEKVIRYVRELRRVRSVLAGRGIEPLRKEISEFLKKERDT